MTRLGFLTFALVPQPTFGQHTQDEVAWPQGEFHPPSAFQRELLITRLRNVVLNEQPRPGLLLPAVWAMSSGLGYCGVLRGGFWAKNGDMGSGHWFLVTKPAGAGAGARSRERRPARTPVLLVVLYCSNS